MRLRYVLLTLVSVWASMGAQHRTTNFIVSAPTPQAAQLVGQWAEHYRREKAQQWLGYEMPAWSQPCPLRVIVSMEPPQGKTQFTFSNQQVISMDMEIQGPLPRLVDSVLPHEITHTVFAHYFRCAVPRWADEGGSVLSEDSREQQRHDQMTRSLLNNGQGFRLRHLMAMWDYPDPARVGWLYAQGFSLADYLVKRSNHGTFLAFVAHGMRTQSWDRAVQDYFGLRNVEELEEAWLKHLRDTKGGQPDPLLVKNTRPVDNAKSNTFVRTTIPTAQPLDPVPVYRGQAPDQATVVTPPIYLPSSGKSSWQPATSPYQTANVQLGQPQFVQPYYPQQQYPQSAYTPAYVLPGQPCSGPQCQPQPYYQPQSTPAPVGPFGYPR
jgi:hypothetical protein